MRFLLLHYVFYHLHVISDWFSNIFPQKILHLHFLQSVKSKTTRIGNFLKLICWCLMYDSTQGSLCPTPMVIHQSMRIQWLFFKNLTKRSITPRWPFTLRWPLHTYANPNISEIRAKVRENTDISEFPILHYWQILAKIGTHGTTTLFFASVKTGTVPIK